MTNAILRGKPDAGTPAHSHLRCNAMKIGAFMAVAASAMFLRAGVVGEDVACAVAEGFLSKSSIAKRVLPGRSVAAAESRNSLWIVHLSPSGYIELAGSTKCSPVISFSADDFAEPEPDSPLFAKMEAESEFVAACEADESREEDAQWAVFAAKPVAKRKLLLAAAPSEESSNEYLAPLIGTSWGQGSPMNDLTPRRGPCGCVATAAGQEFRYWRWPYRFEKARTFAHQYFDDDGKWTTYTIRLDGRVPLDWGKIAASGGASTPVASDKETAYNTAMLTAWMQDFGGIVFKAGAGSGTRKVCSSADTAWYEAGPVMSRQRDGYDKLWTAITNDLAFGSPVQINTPVHQMVVDGYAVDNAGTANETRWINTNYGWGGAICWENFDTATTSGGSAGVFADFQTGYRPQKRVQFESVPRVSATSVPLVWHLAPCYTNKIDGFTLEIAKFAGEMQFDDDFSNSTGVASGEKFKVENGVLGGYPAIQTSYFTYPETYMATDDSVLEFDVQSRYMSGHSATAEICADGGAWETAATIPLSAGKNAAFGTPTHQTVSLAAFAGRTVRLRFKLACTWAGYASGSSPDFIIDNVSLSGVSGFAETKTVNIPRDDSTPGVYGYTASGLENGANYAFTVTPVMTDGSAARSNAATTRIGTPEPVPEILGVSSVACGLELVQDGFFIECARGIVNDIDVDCNAATVDLVALPSHLSILPDEKISVEGENGVFTVHVDATEMMETGKFHDGDMLILTLVATNADGTEAAKNLMLRFNSMRQVMDGTFDVVDSDAATPVWFCGNTTIDAKGESIVFASDAFQGTGNVTLTDSTGGGSFAFESLDGFTGTLTFDDGVSVSLPADMTVFAGKISSDVTLESGETMKIAGMEPFTGGITLAGGTLKIALSDEDVAYGFSTSEISYVTGSVVFVAPDGTETAAVQEGSAFSFAGTANVWTGTRWFGENYTAKWSDGLPENGDYVIFNVADVDGEDVDVMLLNLQTDTRLAYAKTTGDNPLEITVAQGVSTAALSVDVLENMVQTKINTTRFQPTTVIPRANLIIANGMSLSCDIDHTLASNIKTYHGGKELRDAMSYADQWNGTVVFENYTAEGLNPGGYGNKQSTVRFRGVTGWLATGKEFYPAVELVDNGDTPALHWNDGSSLTMATFAALKGTGTFKTSNSSVTDKVLIKDVSAFAGSFNLAAKAVAIADSMPTENLAYTGRLLVGKAATIASGATWTANGGVYLGACELTVAGTLASPLTASAEGAKLTLADGGTIVASAAIAGNYSPSLDFKAGTYKIDADMRETNTVNFCAAEGDVTTLDANGHKMTLAESFFSGSGDITLVSSVSGGSFVIEGVSQDFTGTIRLDGEVNVSLPDDLSSIGGTIAISGASLAYSSAKLGPLSVGVGSTLTVSLTDSEAMKGFSASSVTLDGGTIEFVDQYGTTVGSSTESTTYVKPDGYTLAPVPTAVWVSGEFEDDATLHGGYKITLNDNTVNDSGNIVIGSATTLGAVIDTAAGDFTNATVLVKYTIPSGGAPAENAVPVAMFNNYDFGALASESSSSLSGYWLNGSTLNSSGFAFSSPAPSMSESGYLLISTWAIKPNPADHGTALYAGETLESLSGGEKTSLRFTDTNNRVTKIAIGGPTAAKAVPWSGMAIEAVAVFGNSWLAPGDVALYEFPEAKAVVPSWAAASITPASGETTYYRSVVDALFAIVRGDVDADTVQVLDGSSVDYSSAGFAYDPETQTYTKIKVAIAKIDNGIIILEFTTLAVACEEADLQNIGVVELLAARDSISEAIPSGWSYVSPEDSGTEYGTILKTISEIPGTVSSIELAQENVSASADGEWAEVGTKPIYITLGSATNAFTLSFDADIPDGTYGTLLSWDSVLGTTTLDSRVVMTNDAAKQVIWRKADGTLSTVGYTTSELIQSGEHYIELNWVHNSGATIKVDGEPYYASGSLKFTDYLTSRLAFGGSALGSPDDVLAGLKVKNLNFRVGKQPTEPDEENENFPRLGYVTRLDGTVYDGNDANRAVITNWQTQITGVAKRPVPEGKTDADFSTIDVLFVYDTPGKAYVESNESAWNGASALEVYSAKATAKMNQILCTTDMDTNFWFRMVGVHTVDGTGGTLKEILGKCEGLTGEYKYMLELRDRYGADVIVCPSPNGGGFGGLARLNTLDEIKSRGQNAAYHFATVLLNYSQTHAWVHEIGHNMSLNHYPPANFDPANTWRGLGFQHKIAVDGTSMSSVMAEQGYADFCGGFSSKNHIYHGSRLSISNHLDSTGVLLEAAPYVSQWRSTRVPETAQVECSIANGSSLSGDTEFALSYPDPDAKIYYKAWGMNDDQFVEYTAPFTVPESASLAYIEAYAVKDGAHTATNVVNNSAFSSATDALLGSPKLPWSTYASSIGDWTDKGNGYLETTYQVTGSSPSECTLSTTVVGPDTLSFEHSELLKDNPHRGSWPHTFADSSFTVWVDNEPVYMLRGATNTLENWTTTEIAIPEGTHKVDFTYSHRSGYVSGETVRIKSVALASAQKPEDPDSYAIEPLAVWYKDFKTAEKGGYTLSTSGTTVIADDTYGSTLTIGDAAAVIDTSAANTNELTVLVKYTAAPDVTSAPVVAFGGMAGNGTVGLDVGAYTKADKTLAVYRNFNTDNGKPYEFASAPVLSATGGYLLCARDNVQGFRAYVGESLDSMTGETLSNANIKFSNVPLTKIGIGGGSSLPANANDMVPFTGFVVEKIAVFKGYYTPRDLIPIENPEDAATLSIADNTTWNFAAGATRTYESIGALSASGTIAVTNDTIGVGVYKLAEWTTPQTMSAGYGRVGTLNVPNLPSNITAELVYGVNAIYLRVYDETAQFLKPTLKIWPYGDSITEGFNAGNSKANYRVLIGQKLKLLGYNVAMVGCYDKIQTASGTDNFMDAVDPSGAVIPDEWKWHSAKHGGTLGVTSVTSYQRSAMVENVDTLCAQAGNPDVVLLHGGINDLSVVGDVSTVFANWTNVVWRILEDLPQTKIVVSTTMYATYANKATLNARSDSFNALVKAQVAKAEGDDGAFPAGRVYLADLNTYVRSTETGVLSSDGLHPDWWGHDQMAEGFLSQVTNIFTSANGPFNSYLDYVDDSSLGAAAKTELDGYRNGFTLAQTITVASTNAPTVVNGEGPATGIGKVGYFVEYVRADNETHKWVWVDMDAPATTLADLGLPTANRQQVVTSLHVKSNHNGIDDIAADDDTATGWIEFSPFDYTGGESGAEGAPAAHGGSGKTMFDWNDTLGSSGTMGSMQVFRIAPPSGRPAQALFAYNNWQSDSTAAEFGIGNFAQHFWGGAQTLDYTYTKGLEKMNASAYRVKRIEIWTKAANVRRIAVAEGETATVDDYQPGVTYIISGAGTVAFTQLPAASSLSFEDWTGTLELPAFRASGQVLTDYVVNGVSKLKLNGITGGYLMWNNLDFQSELVLAGDFVLTDMSARDYSFAKISGTGNISLSPGTYELKSFAIGEYSASGIVSNSMSATAIAIGTLALPEGTSVAGGTRLLATGGTGAVSVENVTVGGVAQSISLVNGGEGDEAGLYVESSSATATVVRVHPRLTRGLAREALLGIRFDNALGGNASAFDVHFRLVNCTKADITDIKYWKQPLAHNYGFYEAEATLGPAATVSAGDDATEFTASFPAGSVWFYPQVVGTREDSDYLWVTATINPEISPDAEIWVSVPTAKITLSNGGVFDVVNGAETQPHRVFPFVHQIGAYLRQDGTALTGTWAGKLEDSPANRVGNLTDIVVCNDFLVAYDSENDTFKTTWDARGRDNTAQVARIKELRDQYNPKCMIRGSLTKGEGTITVDGVTGRPIACAAASAARRKQLIDSILAVMESAGLDGLDIDWEYPGDHAVTTANTQRDWHSYGLLMRDLAAAFFDKGYVLSFCSNLGYQMAPSGYYAAFHAADFVNAMAYGNTTLNASPQVMMTGINVCTSRGVPSRRIVVGQAMYAYEVQNPGWGSVVPWLKDKWPSDNTRWWDADLVWTNRTATKADGTVLSTNKETFEGPSSYHAKCNWCRANGYGGVMSWGYYTDVSWDDADLMSLARHQAKSCWPRTNWSWPTPPQDSDGAYLLDSEADWFWLRDNPGVNARFAADIALTHDPLPIETFSGTIDGAGHTLTISNDVWLAYDSNPALIRTLTGTVKNLTIDLYGRVVSRASRWNDTTTSKTANTLAGGPHTAAVLAANLGAGGVIDGVELFIRPGAEVQGPQRVAGLAASVWVGSGSNAEIRNSSVHVEGVVRSLARNTAEGDITVANQCAGGLAGWVGCPGARNIVVTNNIVSLASTGRVAVETGSSSSAGGVIGDLNNGNPLVQSNAVYVASGATVSANEGAGAGNVRTSYANASYSIASSANAGQTTFFIEDGAATLAGSVGGTGEATVDISSYGGEATDGISVDAVAGFWYSVVYGDELVSGGIGGETGETEPVKAAASGPLTLETPKEGATRFYRVKVSPRGN